MKIEYNIHEQTGRNEKKMTPEKLPVQVGQVSANIISALGLQIAVNTPIMLGASNIQHMQKSHPAEYAKYGQRISDILANPDYVGLNPKDSSIEYVKEYVVDGEFVKVAVRISNQGTLYARSIYVLNTNRVLNFIAAGTLKKP